MYLARTHACRFHIKGNILIHGVQQPHEKYIQYVHRWTPLYRKAVIKKFYQLEEWYNKNPMPLTLLTLTTYQDGEYSKELKGGSTSIEEAFCILKRGWRLLTMWLRKYYPEILYIDVMEPHKSGYPHLHVELLGDLPLEAQDTIRRLWSEKYKAGSAEHGVNFTVRSPEQGISSIKNYLLKHIAKTLVQGKTGSKFEDGTDDWTPGELLFNAIVRERKWRLWGASLFLSKVMARRKPGLTDYEWISTELIDENGDVYLVHGIDAAAQNMGFCNGFDPPLEDPDDLSPEGITTQTLWKKEFSAKQRVLESQLQFQKQLNVAYQLK